MFLLPDESRLSNKAFLPVFIGKINHTPEPFIIFNQPPASQPPPDQFSPFEKSSFCGITSIEPIALSAQMDRASAFLRQGVLGSKGEERKRRRRRRSSQNGVGAVA